MRRSEAVLLYQLVLAFPLFKLARLLASEAGALVQSVMAPEIHFLDGFGLSSPTKPEELLHYVLGIAALFVYAAFIHRLNNSSVGRSGARSACEEGGVLAQVPLAPGIAAVVAAMSVGAATPIGITVLAWLIWVLAVFAPYANWRPFPSPYVISAGLLVGLSGLFLVALWPFVSARLPILNEYPEFKEVTRLEKPGETVANREFIARNRLGGMLPYDPDRHGGEDPPEIKASAFATPRTAALDRFIRKNSSAVAYDQAHATLLLREPLDATRRQKLLDEYPQRDREGFRRFLARLPQAELVIRNPQAVSEFVLANSTSLTAQTMPGYFFHHHSQLYMPMRAYLNGVDSRQIAFPYGWLATVGLAEITRAIGGLSLKTYLQASYAFYALYYFLFGLAVFLVFRRSPYALFAIALALGSFFLIGFESVRIAPGFNPLRHFLDVVVLAVLAKASEDLGRWRYWLAAIVVALVQVLISKEFGLILLIAVASGWISCLYLEQRLAPLRAIAALGAIALAAGTVYWLVSAAFPQDTTHRLLLLGSFVPTAGPLLRYIVLFAIAAGYAVLIIHCFPSSRDSRLFLTWFLYVQGLLFYYIWNPAPNHFFSLGAVLAVAVTLAFRLSMSRTNTGKEADLVLIAVMTATAAAALSGRDFILDTRAYEQEAKRHQVFFWPSSSAQVYSTIDPTSFSADVQLIQKYEKGPRVFMISRFDAIIPFLSGKAGAFPFPDLKTRLATSQELEEAAEFIMRNSPEILFVDRDIGRTFLGDIVDPNDPLIGEHHKNSADRVAMYKNLQALFDKVKAPYSHVETARLLDAYARPAGSSVR